ncbi:MAG TPA: hypothetical protein VGD98_11255 [Ktedonobacteraceae bacterium]
MTNLSRLLGRGSAPTVLPFVGGSIMLLALIFAIFMYIWGHNSGPTYSENWNDLIAVGFIIYIGMPVFIVGLVLLLVGLIKRVGR